jgi:hypothetical protein
LREDVLCALRLSKAGYGKPREILEMDADLVYDMLDYENFLSRYEKNFIKINEAE